MQQSPDSQISPQVRSNDGVSLQPQLFVTESFSLASLLAMRVVDDVPPGGNGKEQLVVYVTVATPPSQLTLAEFVQLYASPQTVLPPRESQ